MRITRYIGSRGCQDLEYTTSLSDQETLVIDSYSEGNVSFRLTCDEKPVAISLRPLQRDMIDLAVSIYIADEHISREQTSDHWTRDLAFLVPVQDPQGWSNSEDLLCDTLHTLSGDRYSFQWLDCRSTLQRPRPRRRLPRNFDAVCLFSGGIDSLLGAWQLLIQGRKVLLVGHQADTTTAGVQNELARKIRLRFPGQASFIQCRAARSQTAHPRFPLPEKCEETHRVRSFLFLALASSIAEAYGVSSVFIPENGLIALNVPLQLSRLGTFSTRTAHPKYLVQLLETFRRLGSYSGEIRNPFLYASKTDMLKGASPDLVDFLRLTVSCAHPGRMKGHGKLHCGYCVPCLYRRCAMAEIDPRFAAEYAFDPFEDLGSGRLTETTAPHIRALTGFAKKVVSLKECERQLLLLQHGHFSPDVSRIIGPLATKTYTPWSQMLLRWCQDYLRKADSWSTPQSKKILGL